MGGVVVRKQNDKNIAICRKIFDLTDELRDAWLQHQSSRSAREIMGLTVNQGRLFRAVWRMTESVPQGVMLRDLAEKLGLSSSAVSVMVESLVQRGHLERSVDAEDRRKVMIRLAEKGRRHLCATDDFLNEKIEKFICECDPVKLSCFEEVLDNFNKYLSETKKGVCEK